MDEATRLAIENYLKLNENQRRAFNVRINGEEHHAHSKKGQATIHFPMDGQLMYVSELAMKVIINDGNISGTGDNTNACSNWAYGVNSYKTYEEWLKRYPAGSAVNVDCTYDCQCWDYASAFWRAQVNRNLQTQPGGNGSAWQCWTVSRYANAGTEFSLITRWQDLRKGDWAVWGTVGDGHIAMALDCPATPSQAIMFRDQNGPQGFKVGDNMYGPTFANGNRFLGAFRFKNWKVPACGQIA